MGWQTVKALKERKLNPWLRKRVITKQQYKDIICYCVEHGFWEALGYATRCKYKTNPKLKKKYEYKWINILRKDCQLNDYVTHGSFSGKRQKRHRIWRNVYFKADGSDRIDELKKLYPDWEIFYIKQDKYRVGLRREISNKLPNEQFAQTSV